jgi:hypothetical protein
MSEHYDATSGIAGSSRRGFLKSGVGLVAGSAAAQALPGGAIAKALAMPSWCACRARAAS